MTIQIAKRVLKVELRPVFPVFCDAYIASVLHVANLVARPCLFLHVSLLWWRYGLDVWWHKS